MWARTGQLFEVDTDPRAWAGTPPPRSRSTEKEGPGHSPSKAAGDRVGRDEGAQHVGEAWEESRRKRFTQEGEGFNTDGGGGREKETQNQGENRGQKAREVTRGPTSVSVCLSRGREDKP